MIPTSMGDIVRAHKVDSQVTKDCGVENYDKH